MLILSVLSRLNNVFGEDSYLDEEVLDLLARSLDRFLATKLLTELLILMFELLHLELQLSLLAFEFLRGVKGIGHAVEYTHDHEALHVRVRFNTLIDLLNYLLLFDRFGLGTLSHFNLFFLKAFMVRYVRHGGRDGLSFLRSGSVIVFKASFDPGGYILLGGLVFLTLINLTFRVLETVGTCSHFLVRLWLECISEGTLYG
jgi:hypothetical protein